MTTTYPTNLYDACAWLADELDIDMWEDEEDGRLVFKLDGSCGHRILSPGHCFDELTSMKRTPEFTAEEIHGRYGSDRAFDHDRPY